VLIAFLLVLTAPAISSQWAAAAPGEPVELVERRTPN
jgi:hypothetical protein